MREVDYKKYRGHITDVFLLVRIWYMDSDYHFGEQSKYL